MDQRSAENMTNQTATLPTSTPTHLSTFVSRPVHLNLGSKSPKIIVRKLIKRGTCSLGQPGDLEISETATAQSTTTSPLSITSFASPTPHTEMTTTTTPIRQIRIDDQIGRIKISPQILPVKPLPQPIGDRVDVKLTEEDAKNRIRLLEIENRRVMQMNLELKQEQGQSQTKFSAEMARLRVDNEKVADENRELRELCCFLDDERHKAKKLARDWQRFGKHSNSVIKEELTTCQSKIGELEMQQCQLVGENVELKRLCLHLDEQLRTSHRTSQIDHSNMSNSPSNSATSHDDQIHSPHPSMPAHQQSTSTDSGNYSPPNPKMNLQTMRQSLHIDEAIMSTSITSANSASQSPSALLNYIRALESRVKMLETSASFGSSNQETVENLECENDSDQCHKESSHLITRGNADETVGKTLPNKTPALPCTENAVSPDQDVQPTTDDSTTDSTTDPVTVLSLTVPQLGHTCNNDGDSLTLSQNSSILGTTYCSSNSNTQSTSSTETAVYVLPHEGDRHEDNDGEVLHDEDDTDDDTLRGATLSPIGEEHSHRLSLEEYSSTSRFTVVPANTENVVLHMYTKSGQTHGGLRRSKSVQARGSARQQILNRIEEQNRTTESISTKSKIPTILKPGAVLKLKKYGLDLKSSIKNTDV